MTSGWNCVVKILRSTHSMAATGHTSVLAVTVKPSGTSDTASRWLIHTVCSMGVELKSLAPAVRVMVARPYSPTSEWPTLPPSVTAVI